MGSRVSGCRDHRDPAERAVKAALVIIGATLLALVSLFLIFAAFFTSAPPPAPKPVTGTNPTAPVSRGADIGKGVPGAPCATNRLGETFERYGVTYVCSGPK